MRVVSEVPAAAGAPETRSLPVASRATVTAITPAIPAAQRGKYSVRAAAGRISRLTRWSSDPPVAASASAGVLARMRSISTSADA